MYPTTKKSSIDENSVGALTAIIPTLKDHGITPPKAAVKANERHKEVITHIKTVETETDPATAHTDAARALANGTGTVEQVTAAAATRLIADKDPTSPYRRILAQARRIAAHNLRDAYAEVGDQWIHTMRPAFDKAVTTLAKETTLAPKFDPFIDNRGAEFFLSNPHISDAWQTVQALYRTARTLRRYSIIPNSWQRDDFYEWAGNAEAGVPRGGDTLTFSIRDNLIDGNFTWFVYAMQNGLTPVLHTENDIP